MKALNALGQYLGVRLGLVMGITDLNPPKVGIWPPYKHGILILGTAPPKWVLQYLHAKREKIQSQDGK